MNHDELNEVLRLHGMWLRSDDKGRRAGLGDANLARANLGYSNLARACLARACLTGVNLGGACLAGANLAGANLARANLSGANLSGANLARANLGDANLAGAYLARANLARACLTGVNLGDACLAAACLAGANLAHAYLGVYCGNMREVKTAQFDTWSVTWSRGPDDVTTLQIGSQKHNLERWRKSGPSLIAEVGRHATEWCNKYGAVILALVDASPAVAWGKPAEVTK